MSSSIPASIVSHIKGFFHSSRHDSLVIEKDSKGRIGFWNWDKSAFIVQFDSESQAVREIAHPPAHYPEDALGLGYLNG